MAIINKIENVSSISYGGATINSNAVDTLLLLAPTIIKTVDKLTAAIGDTLTYTITITNVSLSAISNLPFTDELPSGVTYVNNSFTANGTSVTPTLTSPALTYTIPSIPALGAVTLQFQVKIVGGTL